jgi:hypothetical protein
VVFKGWTGEAGGAVDRVRRVGDCDVELRVCLDFSKSKMLLIIYSIVKHHDLELCGLVGAWYSSTSVRV